MVALDTNVVVRLLVNDDKAQGRRARALLSQAIEAGEPCLVTPPVLCELVWVLESVYGARHADIVAAVQALLSHPAVSVDEPDIVRAALDAFQRSRGDYADHLIGALSIARKARTTYTFDQSLKRVEGFTLL